MKDIWKHRDWSPMLLEEIREPFSSEEYIFEMKFDGVRALAFVSKTGIEVRSRNGKDMTSLFPELQELCSMVSKNVIFDGEIVSIENGVPSFSKLQNRMHTKNAHKIKTDSVEKPVKFIAFDILYEDENLCDKKLLERKRILDEYEDNEVFVKSKVYGSDGIALFKEIKRLNLEGIVAKLKSGLYHIDERTDDFIKIKNIKVDEFLVCGYIEKESVVSLLLGEDRDGEIVYTGKVTMGKKNGLYEKLKKSKESKCKLSEVKEAAKYVKPTYYCRVEYLEKTKAEHLRHAVFKGECER